MKKLLGLMFAGVLMTSGLEAALPPLWQGTAEVKAILDDQQLSKVIPDGDVLIKIVKIHDGYLLITNKRKVKVKVNYEKNQMPGPAKFQIEFGHVKDYKHDEQVK